MSIYQGQLFLATDKFGWTETYYFDVNSHNDAMIALDAICTDRMAMSPGYVECIGVRVSDVTIRGDSMAMVPTTAMGTYATVGVKAADPSFAVLMRYEENTHIHRSVHYLRGMPEDVFTFAPLTYLGGTTPTIFRAAMSKWKNTVITNAVMLSRKAGPTYTTFPISGIFDERASIRKAGRPFGLPVGRRVHV